MIFRKSTILAALFVAVASTVTPANATGNLRADSRRLGPNIECTMQVQMLLHLDPEGGEDEAIFDCELDAYVTGGISGNIVPLGISKEQKEELKQMLKNNDFTPGEDRLDVGGGIWDGMEVKVPPGQMKDKVKKGKGVAEGRRLATSKLTGDKPSKLT